MEIIWYIAVCNAAKSLPMLTEALCSANIRLIQMKETRTMRYDSRDAMSLGNYFAASDERNFSLSNRLKSCA